jgi:hypothetical protein
VLQLFWRGTQISSYGVRRQVADGVEFVLWSSRRWSSFGKALRKGSALSESEIPDPSPVVTARRRDA